MLEPRYQPQGSLFQADGSVEWRVWAPRSERVALVIGSEADQQREIIMTPEPFGFHAVRQAKISDGTRYSYKLADGNAFPDPASRSQPDGVHRPSAVFSPAFYWTDGRWPGVDRRDLVFYELHVGTFTCEGTFDAIIPRLDELKSLGVTAVELMPIAQFPGERNWGYDGVYPYAPQNSYGGPRALQRLVDSAHACGLALFLDVVYNHLGPEGCYVNQFGPYFTDHYHTPWGSAINFGDAQSDPVRQFFIDNAVTWIRDFHIDGLRLDAVHAIYDASAQHILAEISTAVHNAGREQNRTVHVVAESNLNDVRIVTPVDRGGYGLDGAWSDDFHHAVHALLTGERDGYYQDFGKPEQLVKALDSVYVYDGCYSPFRRRRHGETVGHTDRTKFVVALQNHDQIGNRALGDRLTTLLPPTAQRLAVGLVFLSPFVPLLFMGEEYGETRPFPFFCSFGDAELVEAIREGRKREFADLAFKWHHEIPDAQSPQTFESAKLEWSWPEGSPQFKLRRLYQDLLRARREWPQLQAGEPLQAELVNRLIILRRGDSSEMIAYANLSDQRVELPAREANASGPRQAAASQLATSASEQSHASSPRSAAVLNRSASPADSLPTILLTTENERYGGARTAHDPLTCLLPYELLVASSAAWRQ